MLYGTIHISQSYQFFYENFSPLPKWFLPPCSVARRIHLIDNRHQPKFLISMAILKGNCHFPKLLFVIMIFQKIILTWINVCQMRKISWQLSTHVTRMIQILILIDLWRHWITIGENMFQICHWGLVRRLISLLNIFQIKFGQRSFIGKRLILGRIRYQVDMWHFKIAWKMEFCLLYSSYFT